MPFPAMRIVWAALLMACTLTADARSDDASDEWQDWQILLSCEKMQPYLNYEGSSLNPLTKVSVEFAQPVGKPVKLYENLYYARTQVVGCKRKISRIGIKSGTAGNLKIVALRPDETNAVANAALRVLLDVSLNDCIVKSLTVPDAYFQSVVEALCKQGMRKDDPGETAGISLEVVSASGADSRVLMR
ncbi:hypothetical protein BH10CYA1_BH10CYA1_01200 [soil metagenome]